MSTLGMFSTLEGYNEYSGRIMSTSGDIMMHVGNTMMHVGDTMSTSRGDIINTLEGYHEHIGGCSVHQGFQ